MQENNNEEKISPIEALEETLNTFLDDSFTLNNLNEPIDEPIETIDGDLTNPDKQKANDNMPLSTTETINDLTNEKFKQIEIEKELQNLKERITKQKEPVPTKDIQKENPQITDEQINNSIQDMLNSLE